MRRRRWSPFSAPAAGCGIGAPTGRSEARAKLARLGGRAAAYAEACAEAERLAERLRQPAAQPTVAEGRHGLARDFFERRFRAFAAGTGLMTGYYEPELRGAEYAVGRVPGAVARAAAVDAP